MSQPKDMMTLLKEKPVLKIIPDTIDNAIVTEVVDCSDAEIYAKLVDGKLDSYSPAKNIEAYFLSGGGYFYFTTNVIKVQDNALILKFPEKYTSLQRREGERINFYKTLEITADGANFAIDVVNLSSGGIRFLTSENLSQEKAYSIALDVDKNLSVQCNLKIVEVTKFDNAKYCARAQFTDIDNSEVVALSQFCKKTVIEQINK